MTDSGRPTGRFHLLAIAIDDYEHFEPLSAPVGDAEALMDFLMNRYGFLQSDIRMLCNKEATRSGIIGALRGYAEQLRPDDSLLIYYSGHGHLDSLTDEGSYMPAEESPDASTWINNHEVLRIIAPMQARHVLLISDSCFAGTFFPKTKEAGIDDAYLQTAFARKSLRRLLRAPTSLFLTLTLNMMAIHLSISFWSNS